MLLAILFLLPLTNTQGQNLKAYEKAANDAFVKKEYYNAVHYYEIVLRSKKTPGLYYQYAESCRLSHAYQAAEDAYKKVVDSKDKNLFPMLEFYYGITLKHNAKYNDAKRAFKYFLQSYRKDNFYKAKAEQELKSCDFAKQLVKNTIPKNELEVTHLNENVNTKYSDFGAHEVGKDTLYYSSLRFDRKEEEGTPKEKDLSKTMISRLLSTANIEKEKGKEIDNLDIPHLHSANSTLSHDGKRLYFTRCSGKRSDSLRCEIFVSERIANGKWSAAERLPNPINSNTATTTQPNLEWHSDSEWLYFVSDRAGGQGGMDIWRVELKEDLTTCEPYNLGQTINSRDEEATPFYDSKTNRLYFASRWHFGLGGYDIFYSEHDKNGEWSEPVNMGIPFNSAANDLYFVINDNDSTGYIASNREGSRSLTKESCCNDIYYYAFLKPMPPADTPEVVEVPLDTPDIVEVPVDTPAIVEVPLDTPDIVEVPVDTPDVPKTIEVTLDELNKLLPLSLYFHNNEPRDLETSYSSTYNRYTGMRNRYKKEHLPQYDISKQEQIAQKIDDFFESDVKGNYEKMHTFFDELIVAMQNDFQLEISIQGYTSPRATAEYNKKLANRRITSVRKDMFSYKDAALKPYLESGQLTIKELPLGEGKAPTGISDDINDPRNSIFSVEASAQRKVNFIVVNTQD